MVEVKIKADRRTEVGKQRTNYLRKNGLIPAVLYGHGEETMSISIPEKEFSHLLQKEKGENVIVEIELPKDKSKKTIIKEIQRDPVTSRILHVDFQHLIMTEKVHVQVPIILKGTPQGVKAGGILEHHLRKINIRCLPEYIPPHIEVEVSELKLGDSIHISDLSVENVEILEEPTETIATIIVPKIMKEEVKEEVVVEEVKEEEKKKEPEAVEEKEK